MEESTVSIIIITRNRPFLLQHCLQRVTALLYPHKEIIVVDSSTNDESGSILTQFPVVTGIRLSGQRNNIPQARNEGIAISTGDIIAFIDDDSMIRPEWLSALLAVYQDEQVGAAGGRVIRRAEPYCDQQNGNPQLLVQPSGTVIAKDINSPSRGKIEVDHLIGCNMSFRRKALEQVGGFDASYTLTNLREETDLCIRVKKAGWRVIYDPSIAVVHVSARAQAFFGDFPSIQYSSGRNSTYFVIKHYGLNLRTCIGQCAEVGRAIQRATFFSTLFITGVFAQLAGRAVGLGVGMTWLLSNKRRVAAAPEIGKRTSSLMPFEASASRASRQEVVRGSLSPRLAAKYITEKDI